MKVDKYMRYFDSKGSATVKVCIAIAILLVLVVILLNVLNKENNDVITEEIVYKYFPVYTLEEKVGVVDKTGKIIIDTSGKADELFKERQRNKNLEKELQDIKTKKYLTHAPFDMKLKDLMEIPLCQKLHEISQDINIKTNVEYPDLRLSEETQKELIDLFNKIFDNIFNKIIAEHEGLKQQDNLYFCLYLLGMNEKHISAVTGKSYNAIYNRTKRIQEILGSEKSIRDILRDMA